MQVVIAPFPVICCLAKFCVAYLSFDFLVFISLKYVLKKKICVSNKKKECLLCKPETHMNIKRKENTVSGVFYMHTVEYCIMSPALPLQ